MRREVVIYVIFSCKFWRVHQKTHFHLRMMISCVGTASDGLQLADVRKHCAVCQRQRGFLIFAYVTVARPEWKCVGKFHGFLTGACQRRKDVGWNICDDRLCRLMLCDTDISKNNRLLLHSLRFFIGYKPLATTTAKWPTFPAPSKSSILL